MRAFAIACSLFMIMAMLGIASADDVGTNPEEVPGYIQFSIMAATSEGAVDNGDGTFTYTQIVDESSTPPHYYGPFGGIGGYGFEEYSWADEDYGWNHTFPNATDPNVTINSVKLEIHAWDIDSEDPVIGEYDHVTGDGVDFTPVYLQGFNNQWSTTVFDVPSYLVADGQMHVFLDIDMLENESHEWATTLDYSKLIVNFSTDGTNNPPYAPELSVPGCVDNGTNLMVTVTGPTPADPDGDDVTYEYRWFIDAGSGYIDDSFAGRGEHTTNTVPASDTQIGDWWKVQVTAVDEHGATNISSIAFPMVVNTCNEIPEFPTIALPIAAILGIAFFLSRRRE